MSKFLLLKRTFPVSIVERSCDGYRYIMDNTTEEERLNLGLENIKENILIGETYMYQVGREGTIFKTSYMSLENFEIIRKYFFGKNDE